jgi:hypothetical protein
MLLLCWQKLTRPPRQRTGAVHPREPRDRQEGSQTSGLDCHIISDCRHKDCNNSTPSILQLSGCSTAMQQSSLQGRVGIFASTPLLTAVRVRAHFAEQVPGGSVKLVPIRRRQAAAIGSGGSNARPSVFEPTHEWKEILPNQVLPAVSVCRLKLRKVFTVQLCVL